MLVCYFLVLDNLQPTSQHLASNVFWTFTLRSAS